MRRVTIVYGPPCAGKSTYVTEHARPGDIVVDWDRLAMDAGSPVEHDHTGRHRAAATRARMEWEDHISAMRDGTAWVIRTLADETERLECAERLRGQLVLIDPGGAECIARARSDGRSPETDETIIRWYATAWGSRALTRRAQGGTPHTVGAGHPGLMR